MRTLLLTALALGAGATTLQAQDSLHVDVDDLFPNVGIFILVVDPNDFGVPPGFSGGGGVTLINDRVVLTAAHITKNSEGGIPPFIHVFVSFNSQLLADRSSWIPVTALAWHPTFNPIHCVNGVCDVPPIYPVPGVSDVGLMLLERPAKDIKPAHLPHPATLETGRGDSQEMIFVSYGPPALGVRRYRVIAPEQVFDDRWALGGVGESCPGDSGGPTFLGPLAASGNERRTVIAVTSGFKSEGFGCRRSRSVTARIDNLDVQSWIAFQTEQWLGPQH